MTELTSLPLVFAAYLMMLSGFCLNRAELVRRLSFGLLDTYSLCSFLHAQELPLLVGSLAIIHSTAGLALMIRRSIKGKIGTALEQAVIAMGAIVMIQLLTLVYS